MSNVAICDTCTDAALDEGVPDDEVSLVMRELGGDLADHLCDQIESDGDIRCSCGCHPR